jgi:hypothetical protein
MLTPAVSDPGYGWGVRADRLVSLALLLQARGRMSAHALAGELEVSVRTVSTSPRSGSAGRRRS